MTNRTAKESLAVATEANGLLPCPFCGAEVDDSVPYATAIVHKPGCFFRKVPHGRRGVHGFGDHTPPDAVEAWNTRTASGADFSRAVHDGQLWRRVKGRKRCGHCGLNIESVIPLDGCNESAVRFCPNCGKEV